MREEVIPVETWQILVTVGVPSGIFGFAVWLIISIHALREEGDSKNRDKISIFL